MQNSNDDFEYQDFVFSLYVRRMKDAVHFVENIKGTSRAFARMVGPLLYSSVSIFSASL